MCRNVPIDQYKTFQSHKEDFPKAEAQADFIHKLVPTYRLGQKFMHRCVVNVIVQLTPPLLILYLQQGVTVTYTPALVVWEG